MIPARIFPAAANDLLEIAAYLDAETPYNLLGTVFLRSAAATIAKLEAFPEIGRVRPTANRRLGHIRSLAVSAPFSRYLIFYRYRNDELSVVRVLHGAMDLKGILGIIS